jgi:hypothetical protein
MFIAAGLHLKGSRSVRSETRSRKIADPDQSVCARSAKSTKRTAGYEHLAAYGAKRNSVLLLLLIADKPLDNDRSHVKESSG